MTERCYFCREELEDGEDFICEKCSETKKEVNKHRWRITY